MAPILDEEEAALDPYAILELPSDASEKDIQRAYRKKSLKCHPDRNQAPEAVVQFRQISLSLEILTNVNKRSYVDNKLDADRKKKARYAEMDKKRKDMVDALNAREEDAKRAKVDAVQRRQQAAEEEAIKDAGRRLLEEAQRKAAAAATAAMASATTAQRPLSSGIPNVQSNGTSSSSRQPDITPTDLTLIISVPPSSSTSSGASGSTSAQVQADLSSRYGPISHLILNDPPKVEGKKKKSKKVVVEFTKGNWGGCWACWKDLESGKPVMQGGEGGKAKWAGGETPAWVKWAEEQKPTINGSREGASTTSSPPPSNGNGTGNGYGNGNSESQSIPSISIPSSFNGSHTAPPFDSAPDFTGTTMASLLASHAKNKAGANAQKKKNDEFESMTLFRMRQLERERLEEQIRREEGDD